jgi:hypothetical protein
VFANPHGAETAGLGHQGQFGQVFEQLAVADAFVPALHVYEQGKFHDATSDLLLMAGRLRACVTGVSDERSQVFSPFKHAFEDGWSVD